MKRISVATLLVIAFAVSLMTPTLTLMYLGTSFKTKELKNDDWRRKWLIFFAYFNIVTLGMFAPIQNWTCVLSVMSSTIILCYLGTSFGDKKIINPDDWERRWLIIMAYVEIVVVGLILLTLVGTLSFIGVDSIMNKL